VLSVDMIVSRADRGGFFYREPRVSRGRMFGLLKFRTLRRDVLDQMRAADGHARLYEADSDNQTWTGGPRPGPPEMVRRQVAEGRDYRNRIPAGLTGPAQVTKGEGIRYEDLDSRYVEAWSSFSSWALVRYDLQILRQTLAVIARGEGLNF